LLASWSRDLAFSQSCVQGVYSFVQRAEAWQASRLTGILDRVAQIC